MTRSALSGSPASDSAACAVSLACNWARNPAASAGSPTPAQNAGSCAAHSAGLSSWPAQFAYACAPATAMSPVRSSSAR